ncbi:MAG TPA: MarR family transcriptional regulator [Anaerolineales bacterium]|nr:MarR family transcriptional regulator [Anaerolineales bacterium]
MTAKRATRVDDPQQPARFIEALSLFFEGYGLPRIAGRMLGLFMLSEAPLKAEQIATQLGVSRSSVSSNLRMLESARLIERVRLGHDRSDYFEMPESPWQSLLERRLAGLAPMQRLAEAGRALPVSAAKVKNRLRGFQAYVTVFSELHQAALARWMALGVDESGE